MNKSFLEYRTMIQTEKEDTDFKIAMSKRYKILKTAQDPNRSPGNSHTAKTSEHHPDSGLASSVTIFYSMMMNKCSFKAHMKYLQKLTPHWPWSRCQEISNNENYYVLLVFWLLLQVSHEMIKKKTSLFSK